MQIAVGGCLAQMDRDRIRQRASHVDVVFGTHNLTRAPALLRQARRVGPGGGDPRRAAAGRRSHGGRPAGGRPGRGAGPALRGLGDHPDRLRQLLCLLHRPLGAGRRGLPAARTTWWPRCEALAGRGVTEVTLLGQNVNSYGRDLTRRGPLFADLLRPVGAVEGIRRVRFTSPHPKDLRPETIAAMAETAGGLQPPPPPAAVGLRRHADRHAAGLHRRAVPGPPGRGPGRHRRPGRHHRPDRRVPRGDRRRLRAHPRGGGRGRPTTAPTPSSSRPDRGPGPRP